MVGVGLELLELCVSMGYKMIVAGGDVPFLANTSKQAAADARKVLHGLKASSASKEGKGPASPY
jgi:hypothetical protein